MANTSGIATALMLCYLAVGLAVLITVFTDGAVAIEFAAWPIRRKVQYVAILLLGWPFVIFGKDVE